MKYDVSILKLSEMEGKELIPGAKGRFVHSENTTLAYWQFEAGTLLPEHSHPQEQITLVTQGTFDLTVEDETFHLEAGMVAVIPPEAHHAGTSITRSQIIDVFYPVREDFR